MQSREAGDRRGERGHAEAEPHEKVPEGHGGYGLEAAGHGRQRKLKEDDERAVEGEERPVDARRKPRAHDGEAECGAHLEEDEGDEERGEEHAVEPAVAEERARGLHPPAAPLRRAGQLGQRDQGDDPEQGRRGRVAGEEPEIPVARDEARGRGPEGEAGVDRHPVGRVRRDSVRGGDEVGEERAARGPVEFPGESGQGAEKMRIIGKLRACESASMAAAPENIERAIVFRRPMLSARWPPSSVATTLPTP